MNDDPTQKPTVAQHPYGVEDELTLGQLLRSLGRYARMLLGYWWIIGSVALICGIWFYWSTLGEPARYRAELTFMLNEDERGAAGGLAGILGQSGLGGGGGEYSLEKIAELSKSQLIVQQVLLDSVEVDGHTDRLAHHIIDVYGLRNTWKSLEREDWATIKFPTDTVERLDLVQRRVLQYLYGRMLGNSDDMGLFRISFNPAVGMMSITAETWSESLSQMIAETTFSHLSSFYIDKQTKGPRRTYETLRVRTDSIRQSLDQLEYRIAQAQDVSTAVFPAQNQVRLRKLEREQALLRIMYGEASKNLATAEFTLGNVTPFFAVVDRPFLPLKRLQANPRKQLFTGLLFGFFLTVMVLAVWLVLREAVRQG